MIYEIKGVWHVHNFELNMAVNGRSINDSFVLKNLGNVNLDIPMNFHTSVHTSNNSLRKMEKYISEKKDEAALVHLKEQIVAELRKELSVNNYLIPRKSLMF